jgi:uncharacterized protein YjiS (DUF1127 family)
MWFVARLSNAHSSVPALVLFSHRFQRRFRSALETVRAWHQCAREREALRRYLRYELRGAPNDLGKDVRMESAKRFWEI